MGKATRRIRDAGAIVEIVQYSHVKRKDGPTARQAKRKATSDVMQRYNHRSSVRKFELMLAANYRAGDVMGTLTFDDDHLPSTKAEAERRFRYWRTKIRKIYQANGVDPVIFWRSEHRHGDGRWHVHFIMTATGDDYENIRTTWIYGAVQDFKALRVDEEKNYRTIAQYLTKERPDKLGSRGWSYTRNARKPEEQQRVGDLVGEHAVAAEVDRKFEAERFIDDHAERDGVGSAVFVIAYLAQIEVVNALILAGITAEGETPSDEFEGIFDALPERARENAGFGGGIIDEFAGLAGELNDLALIDDDHELTLVDGDLGAVGNDVVAALGVAAALAVDDLLSLGDEDVLRQSFAVEKFFPLIGENSAQGSEARFNKSHCNISLYDILVLLFVIRRSAAYIRYIL